MSRMIIVRAAFDPEAGVWFVESSDVPGLAAEAESVEALGEKLPGMIADLLEENGMDGDGEPCEAPIEIIAHMQSRVRIGAEAA